MEKPHTQTTYSGLIAWQGSLSQVFRSCPLKREQTERRNSSYDCSQRGVEECEVDGGSYISRALNAKRLWRTRLLKRD